MLKVIDAIQDFLNMLWSVTKTINIFDIFDICLISYIVYAGILLIRETKASQLVKGILLFLAIYFLSVTLKLKVLSFLLQNILQIGLLALLIMFQPELRRILEKVGRTKIAFGNFTETTNEERERIQKSINTICEASENLSLTTTGALIVIERQTRLAEQIDTGTVINAEPSVELFENIFYNKAPLHDGAVIIRDGLILAAACFLPKPQREELINKQLGSRHRAAIGMSENSDAVVIVVSEETGTISIAENGELFRELTRVRLQNILETRLLPKNTPAKKPKKPKKKPEPPVKKINTAAKPEEKKPPAENNRDNK